MRLLHPIAGELRWERESLELRDADAQQIVVFLPADEATARAMEGLRSQSHGTLRAV